MIKYLPANTKGEDYVVGDLHGCYAEFKSLLTRIKFDKAVDRMFSVGDLIDRGKDSLKCLELINEPWFHAVRGNHEDMFLGWMTGDVPIQHYRYNGGGWVDDYTHEELLPYYMITNELPYMIEVGKIGIVHADLASTYWENIKDDVLTDANNARQTILWGRNRIRQLINSRIIGIDNVILGHTVVPAPVDLGNTKYIDTGCVFGGSLTCYHIGNDEYIK